EFEHDPPGLDPAHPELGRSLAAAHPHFGGLMRYRYIRKDANPDPAGTPNVPRDRAARSLDLASRNAARIRRFQTVGPKIQRGSAFGQSMDAALVRLAVLAAFGA